jgi:hypothetical protein
MLREIRNVRQVPGEMRRRWFTSESMDLIVWLDDADDPTQMQLCYDKGRRRAERALTWKPGVGYTHTAVDDGETGYGGRYKATPILLADGGFNTQRVSSLFLDHSTHLPLDIVDFVVAKIREFGPDSNELPPHNDPSRPIYAHHAHT